MLTKSLARYRNYKGKIKPGFIDVEQPDLVELATALVNLFTDSKGQTREELAEPCTQLAENAPCDAMIVRGMEKLLLDRTTFDAPDDEVLPNWRAEVFQHTASLLSGETELDSLDAYYKSLEQKLGEPVEALGQRLFSDLPAFHPVTDFKKITPIQLLHRYNLGLVQWLLLNTSAIEVDLPSSTPGSLRQLLKYMRWNQLLATIKKSAKKGVKLHIDGPISLFHQTKKYGMNLARFFPALLHQKAWQLRADIKIGNNKPAVLELDQSCGIQPETNRFHGYIPDEMKVLKRDFSERAPGWSIKEGGTIIPLEGEVYCFPDFTLKHEAGKETALELFHGWHASHLQVRLAQVDRLDGGALLIGVTRKLAKKPEVAAMLEGSGYFEDWGFLFSEIPSVKQIAPLLDKL